MPRERVITKEKVLSAAIEVLQRDGEKGLNARAIAKQLNASTQPVYSTFKNMAELKEELLHEAERRYRSYAISDKTPVKNAISQYHHMGMVYLTFAIKEKTMFNFLYMRKRENPSKWIDDVNIEEILDSIMTCYGASREIAEKFHHDMSIYTFGLAVLISTGYSAMTLEDASKRLQIEFLALHKLYFPDIKLERPPINEIDK